MFMLRANFDRHLGTDTLSTSLMRNCFAPYPSVSRDDECGFFVLAYAEAVKAACGPGVGLADAMGRGALSEYMPTLNERAIAIRRQELRAIVAERR